MLFCRSTSSTASEHLQCSCSCRCVLLLMLLCRATSQMASEQCLCTVDVVVSCKLCCLKKQRLVAKLFKYESIMIARCTVY